MPEHLHGPTTNTAIKPAASVLKSRRRCRKPRSSRGSLLVIGTEASGLAVLVTTSSIHTFEAAVECVDKVAAVGRHEQREDGVVAGGRRPGLHEPKHQQQRGIRHD